MNSRAISKTLRVFSLLSLLGTGACQQVSLVTQTGAADRATQAYNQPTTLEITLPEDVLDEWLTSNAGSGAAETALALGDIDADGFTLVCDSSGTQLAVQLMELGTSGNDDQPQTVVATEWTCTNTGTFSFSYLGVGLKKTTELRLKFTTSAGSKILIGHHLASKNISFDSSSLTLRAFEYLAIKMAVDFIKRLKAKTTKLPSDMGEVIETVMGKIAGSISTDLLDNVLVSETSLTTFPDLFFDDSLQRAVFYFITTIKSTLGLEVQNALGTTLSTDTINTVTTDVLGNAGSIFTAAYHTVVGPVTSGSPALSLPACLDWQQSLEISVSGTPIHRMAVQVSRTSTFSTSNIILSKSALSAQDFPITIPAPTAVAHELFVRSKWSSDSAYGSAQPIRLCHIFDLNQDGREELVVTSSGTTPQVHVFLGQGSFAGTLAPTDAVVNFTAPSANAASFGTAVRSVAFNDDAYDDLVINERLATGASNLYILASKNETFATSSNLASRADLIATRSSAPPLRSLLKGDVDGDGVLDFIFTASGENLGAGTNTGAILISYGPVVFTSSTFAVEGTNVDVRINADQGNNQFANDVQVGDLNGDGKADIVISSPGFTSANALFPRVDIVWGSDKLASQFDVSHSSVTTIEGISPDHVGFGVSSMVIGNLNGDSFQDIAIGVNNATNTVGRVYVFYGASNLSNTESYTLASADVIYTGTAAARLGTRLRTADVNRDGLDDLLISAPSEPDTTNTARGAVYIVFGNKTLPSRGATRVLTSNASTYSIRIMDSSKAAGGAWGTDFNVLNLAGTLFPMLVSQWSTGTGNNGALSAYDLQDAFGDVSGKTGINLGEFRGPNDASGTENNRFGIPVL